MIRLALAALLAVSLLVANANARAPGDRREVQALPRLDKIVVIVLENKRPRMIFGNPAAPTLNALARRYATLTHYDAIAHPSLPNYIALVSGSTHGIESNCVHCSIAGRNLADALQRAGRSWKTYAEGLPAAGFEGFRRGWYTKKVNPLLYFRDVASSPERRARIVPFSTLPRDVARRRLPDFSLVLPNLCHDMHSCSVSVGDSWLRRWLPSLLRSPQLRHGAVFVLFDEGAGSDHTHGGGHVPALVLGPAVRRGAATALPFDHYSVLRTIEQAWRLPELGKSRAAAPISGIWRRARARSPFWRP